MAGGGPTPIRVVLADDTREVRILLRLALETHGGFAVVGEADDGDAAIDLCRAEQPDLCLLDLAMPRVSGLEALPQILAASPSTKVVVLSGLVGRHSAAEAMAAGAHAYLEKGASANDVIATLLATVGGSASGAVNEPGPGPVDRPASATSDDMARFVHDLITPLTVIQGFAETLSRRLDDMDPASVRAAADAIVRAVGDAQEVVDRMAHRQEPGNVPGHDDG